MSEVRNYTFNRHRDGPLRYQVGMSDSLEPLRGVRGIRAAAGRIGQIREKEMTEIGNQFSWH